MQNMDHDYELVVSTMIPAEGNEFGFNVGEKSSRAWKFSPTHKAEPLVGTFGGAISFLMGRLIAQKP